MTDIPKRRITIFGSTGSIGVNCLEVLNEFPDKFTVQYLTSNTHWETLLSQAQKFKPQAVAITGIKPELSIEKQFKAAGSEVWWGYNGLNEIARQENMDLVINALVGAVGLKPTILAIEAGKNLALSNKETLVIAGEIVMQKARQQGVSIIPIDSEHSAILQCLFAEKKESIHRLIITASGGPFLHRQPETFADITVAEALKHPNWNMGRKITIDSATLMNKGLEIIEAHWLFNVPPDKMRVLIHPSSIVHSMVEFIDGAIKAQLGVPDMKIPIQYALSFPERWDCQLLPHLDLSEGLTLEFFPPDFQKFPSLTFAFEAIKAGGTAPAILNAANEAAVQLFLEEKIRFDQIFIALETALENYPHTTRPDLDQLLTADQWGREFVLEKFNEF